ncbi:peptidylprolyl isomerase [Hydrogenophaga sp.]|uniref:FKBP-type peptidyl-prolyl cis-trans isomerase n=1 Tax=Hydrogenophaga sp. TaxID=1904254 RepID=UPI0019A141E8|nr:peptidylprolyl isomerase [Hydrogenophaga sp.]MBD3894036.1 peptidylprolyl isomerase [Hydrogenophaga sp.]
MKNAILIASPCVVALSWTLRDTLGETLDVLDEPVEFFVGGSDLLSTIEQALQDHATGDKLELQLEPQDAFGDYDERLLFLEPRHLLPPDLEEGMSFEGLPSGCNPAAPPGRLYFVSGIYPEHVVLDGNHPLAGIALRLSLKVHAVRAASPQEIERGTLGAGFFSTQLGSTQSPGGAPATLH